MTSTYDYDSDRQHSRGPILDELAVEYEDQFRDRDPLSVTNLLSSKNKVRYLRDDEARRATNHARYVACLNKYDVIDELAMLLTFQGAPVAVACLHRKPGDAPFMPSDSHDEIRRYLEFNLRFHCRLRRKLRDMRLTRDYRLTEREREVVDLIGYGASNSDIADQLSLEVSTVKSHVINILKKLGLASRTAINAFCHELEM